MNLKTFFEHFDTLAEAPNGIQRLRELILDMAVRGKLVPQDPEDESTLNLLINVQKEKHDKGLSKKLLFEPICKEDIFYSVPDFWQWVRLGEVILRIEAGSSPQCEKRSKTESEWGIIKISAISWDRFNPNENKALPSSIPPKKEFEICVGDFLMSRANTKSLVGKSVVVESTPPRLLINDKTLRVIFPSCLEKRFFNIYNNSSCARLYFAGEGTGTSDSMKNITRSQICNLPVPLPPLAEQKRIVAKVDELMALCDALEAAQQTRNTLRQKLRASALDGLMNVPSDGELETAWTFVRDNWGLMCDRAEDVDGLRQSIYEIAVQGKLANQAKPSQSAQELLKSVESEKANEIAQGLIKRTLEDSLDSDDFPFMIPDSWKWIRFGTIIFDIEAGTSPQCQKRPREIDEWGVIKISAVSWGEFNPSENKALPKSLDPRPELEIKQGDFIMSRANTSFLVGRSVVVERPTQKLLLNDKTLRIYFSKNIEKRFFNIYNNSFFARQYFASIGTGTSDSMKNITRGQIRNLPVPLPPLTEQKRIVAKVDELMKLCDQLEESLRQQQQKAQALAASAISHLAA